MIAACPKCQTRYRVEADRLGPDGARLRCSQCSAVFRVRLPESTPASVPLAAPALEVPAPSVPVEAPSSRAARGEPQASEDPKAHPAVSPVPRSDAPTFDHHRLVLVAHPSSDACKRLAEVLEREGLQVLVAHDGVEAILSIQRALPRVVVLDAALPKMFGFQVCELVKRNESLRTIHVCLMGAIHKEDRYRRAPNEIYGADFYVEPPALPGALLDWLDRLGLPLESRPGRAEPQPEPTPTESLPTEAPRSHATQQGGGPASDVARSEPKASEAPEARPSIGTQPRSAERRAAPSAGEAPRSAARPGVELAAATPTPPAKLTLGRVGAPASPLDAERAQAERLARIIVSDIVLYNEEKFTAAVRSGNAVEALRDELEEGRALFRERIDARIREERDYLADELDRVARSRGMA